MKRLSLANYNTRIEKVLEINGVNVYIKRDDQTGCEMSGNKIRKLDYVLKEALDNKCDSVITCGAIQTNHGRATAIAATKLGLKPYLVLKNNETNSQGNFFLNQIIGANIKLISEDDYSNRNEIMEELKKSLMKDGLNPYVIKEGASDGLGNFGYYNCLEEILIQSKEMNVKFDYIVSAYGSGSTYTGLLMGIIKNGVDIRNIGYNIYNKNADNIKRVKELYNDSKRYISLGELDDSVIDVRNEYVGEGYAKNTKEEIKFLIEFARKHGIILDTSYTLKAMRGMLIDISENKYKKGSNILFIHTGGIFGNFSKMNLIMEEINEKN